MHLGKVLESTSVKEVINAVHASVEIFLLAGSTIFLVCVYDNRGQEYSDYHLER